MEDKILIRNKKAFHDYHILEKLEAGIELRGTEVKSCRARNISLVDSYVKFSPNEARLLNLHIATYEHGNRFNHDPKRSRRLLLHKREILRLGQVIKEKGGTVIPLSLYLKNGRVKVEIGLAKGKLRVDKRQDLKKRQHDLEAKRAMKS